MHRKRFPSVIVIAALLAVAVGYFLVVKKSGESSVFSRWLKLFSNPQTLTQTPPPSLPLAASSQTVCKDEPEGKPVIASLSRYSGPVGIKFEIRGCNFSGFEGDKIALIENTSGVKGLLYGEVGSTSKLLIVILKSRLCQKDVSYSGLPCDSWLTLVPGTYKIYVMPWGKKSNEVGFTVR